MKMVLMIVDGARREELEAALEEAGVAGYTELPHAAGLGATGPRLGSRAFPGTSAVIFTIVADNALEPLRSKLRELCAACGERLRLVAWDVEVTNQANEPVAVYTILTLVRRLAEAPLSPNGGAPGNGVAAPADTKLAEESKDPGPRAAKVG